MCPVQETRHCTAGGTQSMDDGNKNRCFFFICVALSLLSSDALVNIVLADSKALYFPGV